MRPAAASAALAIIGAVSILADFSYQQTTRITGGIITRFAGAAAKPIEVTVAVRGHRMALINPHVAMIIDLDKDTIAQIDFDTKTFSVMTFDEMRQGLDAAMQAAGGDKLDVRCKTFVKETGETRTIAGLPAKEVVLTQTLEVSNEQTGAVSSVDITNDTWFAQVDGYNEARTFAKLLAEKLEFVPGQNLAMLARRPELIKGMTDLYRQMAEMDGVAVQMTTQMGGSATGSSASQLQPASGTTSTRLGVSGFGRGRRTDQQPADAPAPPQSGPFMESTTEMSGFSTARIDDSKFQVPEGFKKVEPRVAPHHR